MDMMMNMTMHNTFYFGTMVHNFLVKGWSSMTSLALLGMCGATLGLALLIESLKLLRAYIQHQAALNPLTYAQTQENISERSPLLSALIIPPSLHDIKKRRVKLHVAQTFVHMFTHVVGYTLMLVVMSYNAYIGLTVALGGGLGYFIFRGLQIVYIDGKTSPSTEGEGPTIEREAGYSGTYSTNSDTDAMPTPAGAYLDT